MQPNVLLALAPDIVDHIMNQPDGQKRVNELLSIATNRRISRNIIATVAQQEDYMKRIRCNGGARSELRPEGFLVLGGNSTKHRVIAEELGCVIPQRGEVVSVMVTPTTDQSGSYIENRYWRLADPGEKTNTPAPLLSFK